MITGWPQISESFCPNVRARMSVALPAVNGTTILTGLARIALAECERRAQGAQREGRSAEESRRPLLHDVKRAHEPSPSPTATFSGSSCNPDAPPAARAAWQNPPVMPRPINVCTRSRVIAASGIGTSWRRAGVEAEVQVLAQQMRRERHLEVEVRRTRASCTAKMSIPSRSGS